MYKPFIRAASSFGKLVQGSNVLCSEFGPGPESTRKVRQIGFRASRNSFMRVSEINPLDRAFSSQVVLYRIVALYQILYADTIRVRRVTEAESRRPQLFFTTVLGISH